MRGEPAAYERAIVRWIGRYCLERSVALHEVRRAVFAFERLRQDPEAVRELEALCG